jgi:hypothetical protein
MITVAPRRASSKELRRLSHGGSRRGPALHHALNNGAAAGALTERASGSNNRSMDSRGVDSTAKEVAQEKAQALALTARSLESALRALREHDARGAPKLGDAKRAKLVAHAAERVLHYIVQREAQGLRDPRYVFDFYSVPTEVIARLGARA